MLQNSLHKICITDCTLQLVPACKHQLYNLGSCTELMRANLKLIKQLLFSSIILSFYTKNWYISFMENRFFKKSLNLFVNTTDTIPNSPYATNFGVHRRTQRCASMNQCRTKYLIVASSGIHQDKTLLLTL